MKLTSSSMRPTPATPTVTGQSFATAETVGPGQDHGRQGLEDASQGETREYGVVHHGERLGGREAFEPAGKLGGECGRHGTDEMIVSTPVLLSSKPEAVNAREPAGLRVERLGRALAGSADAEGKIEWGMPTLGDDTLDLLGQREDHDPLGVSFQEGEEGAGEGGGGGGGTETLRHFVAQIVVDVQQSGRGLRVGPAVRLVHAAGRVSRRHPAGAHDRRSRLDSAPSSRACPGAAPRASAVRHTTSRCRSDES